jgi:hypothetical protein
MANEKTGEAKMTPFEIMLAMFDGKATTEKTAARLFEAFCGKPCPPEFLKNEEDE